MHIEMLLKAMLSKNPELRPSAVDIYSVLCGQQMNIKSSHYTYPKVTKTGEISRDRITMLNWMFVVIIQMDIDFDVICLTITILDAAVINPNRTTAVACMIVVDGFLNHSTYDLAAWSKITLFSTTKLRSSILKIMPQITKWLTIPNVAHYYLGNRGYSKTRYRKSKEFEQKRKAKKMDSKVAGALLLTLYDPHHATMDPEMLTDAIIKYCNNTGKDEPDFHMSFVIDVFGELSAFLQSGEELLPLDMYKECRNLFY